MWPVGDHGRRDGGMESLELAALHKPAVLDELCAAWEPYRCVSTWYLWRRLGGPAAPDRLTR